jgi:putrescine aminotransferase
MVRGDGIYLWDSEGHKLIDGMSGLWCVNVGYGRASMTAAVARQMDTLPFYNSFFNTTNVPAVMLAARWWSWRRRLQHVFFTGSGSEANDTILRMVWRYWQLMGQPQRQAIISRRNAYHGSTVAGPRWAAWRACTRRARCRSRASTTSTSPITLPSMDAA